MLFPANAKELPPIARLTYSLEFVTATEEAELVMAIDAAVEAWNRMPQERWLAGLAAPASASIIGDIPPANLEEVNQGAIEVGNAIPGV